MSDQPKEQPVDNRYSLVNNVAQRAKVILSRDTATQVSNHKAIHQALEQVDDNRPESRKLRT